MCGNIAAFKTIKFLKIIVRRRREICKSEGFRMKVEQELMGVHRELEDQTYRLILEDKRRP